MEHFDSEMAKRVWQRVQAGSDLPISECSAEKFVARELAESQMCLRLSKQLRGQDSRALQKMALDDKGHRALLQGICCMTGRTQLPAVPIQDTGTISQRLKRCYGRKLQLATEYEKHASEPQFGNVYQKLADREYEHCRTLLAIIGKYG